MNPYLWADHFRDIYDRAVVAYRSGNQRPNTLFPAADVAFLATIGCSAQELFDFVEDFCRQDEPSYETVLLVTAVRRDFFLTIQGGKPSGRMINMDLLPAKSAMAAGIPWLPRLIVKARAKLRGEMPPELMYGCGGDRPFLEQHQIHLADFLRFVWAAGDNDAKIIDYVREQAERVAA